MILLYNGYHSIPKENATQMDLGSKFSAWGPHESVQNTGSLLGGSPYRDYAMLTLNP